MKISIALTLVSLTSILSIGCTDQQFFRVENILTEFLNRFMETENHRQASAMEELEMINKALETFQSVNQTCVETQGERESHSVDNDQWYTQVTQIRCQPTNRIIHEVEIGLEKHPQKDWIDD